MDIVYTNHITGTQAGPNCSDSEQRIWKTAQRKMSLLHVATTTLDLNLPGMNIEPLKHDRPGFYSARINDQYRLIFQFQDGDAFNVGIEDFHGRKKT